MIKQLCTVLLSVSFLGLAACNSESKPHAMTEPEPPLQSTTDARVSSAWEKLIQNAQRQSNVAAMGGVIMQNGLILEEAFAGTKKYQGNVDVSHLDLWHIGSITKPMTATMLARLVEQGILDWDDTIGDVFGEDKSHVNWHAVSLRELLTHTAGADANFSQLTLTTRPETEEKTKVARQAAVAEVLSKERQLRSEFNYSNVGYTIAAHMAEYKTGKSWEVLMREQVFEPLELSSAGFGAPQTKNDRIPIWGHVGNAPVSPSDFSDNSSIMGPAGTVHMSLQDLAKFGQMHLNGLKAETNYLTQATFAVLHQTEQNNYAMGWIETETESLPANAIFWHNGSNTMWYALLLAVPEENLVYALATNSGDLATVDPLFNSIVTSHLAEIKKENKAK